MSRFTFKPIHKAITSEKTYTMNKEWVITDETAGTYGITEYVGQFSRGSWNISDINDTNITNELTTTNSYYQREIFDSIHTLYYTDPENATLSGDSDYFKQQTRDLHRRVQVVSLPSNIFGIKIQEGSVTMSNNNVTLYDDGIGNLYDNSISNQSNFSSFTKDDYHIKVDFNDGWKYQNGNIITDTTFKTVNTDIVDISNGPYEPKGYNISFEYTGSGEHGVSGSTAIVLHGSSSWKEGNDSYIEIERSRELQGLYKVWDNDFSIAMWIKAPLSQSLTSSYSGNYNETTNKRNLVSNGYNVVATSREKHASNPWELQIYNSSHSKKGHLRFQRGLNGTYTSITSSAALNDGQWHHVAIQTATGSMQLYVDGTIQDSVTDPAYNIACKTTSNIHIGTRPFFKKQKVSISSNTLTRTPQGESFTPKKWKHQIKNYIYPFKGSIDRFRIYNRALTNLEVSSLSTYVRDSNIIGNVFYNHGMVVITDMSGSYRNMVDDYTLTFKGTKNIAVHNYRCIVENGEFNVSLNPTARQFNDINNAKPKGFTSGSDFNPYITTIGLYNDNNDLLAIGKLAYPVRSPEEIDIIFNVQFDT